MDLDAKTGRDVCVYVTWVATAPHIRAFEFLTPWLVGVKYKDTGEKDLIKFEVLRNSILQLLVVYALVLSLGGWIIMAILATILGIVGPSDQWFAFYGLIGGLLLAWGSALGLVVTYVHARAG